LKNDVVFYLGANTPGGFCSLYDWMYEVEASEEIYLIKGGPGTGKSSFMRKIGEELEKEGARVSYYACSSDPTSLDGVYFEDINVGIIDATKPHAQEPRCAGALERYINFSDYWDGDALKKSKSEIIRLNEAIRVKFDSLYRSLKAAKCLYDERLNLVLRGVNLRALELRGTRMAAREIKGKGKGGHLVKRFLSAFTDGGVRCEFGTVDALCQKVYVLEDEYGLSQYVLNPILKQALKQEFEVIACYCPLSGERLEHLLIPELSLAFVTSNGRHAYMKKPFRRKRIDKMVSEEHVRRNRVRLRFLNRTMSIILDECEKTLADEKALHDELESHYIPNMDFEALDRKREALTGRLLGMYRTIKN